MKNIKIAFITNFMNHHQKSLADELFKIYGNNFLYISTTTLPAERKELGYEDFSQREIPYLKNLDFDSNELKNIIKEFDVVIIGSLKPNLIRKRIKTKKLTFIYSERLFKKDKKSFKVILATLYSHSVFNNNTYLLSASGYATYDFNLLGLYKNKSFKWGYFPEIINYDNKQELITKNDEPKEILWVGRLIDWKNPHDVIEMAKNLKERKFNFNVKIIGAGPLLEELENLVSIYNLENQVKLLGSIPSNKVKKHMINSDIFVFSSNKGEGWGVVLNEAMEGSNAIVANHQIGSVPYLIENNYNGLIYENGNIEDLTNKVEYLLINSNEIKRLGYNAYKTISSSWTPEVAAERLSKFIEDPQEVISGKYSSGPLSRAKSLSDDEFWEVINA